MEQKTNKQLIEESIKNVNAPQGSLDYRAITIWHTVINLLDIVKNQQQEIEQLKEKLEYHLMYHGTHNED